MANNFRFLYENLFKKTRSSKLTRDSRLDEGWVWVDDPNVGTNDPDKFSDVDRDPDTTHYYISDGSNIVAEAIKPYDEALADIVRVLSGFTPDQKEEADLSWEECYSDLPVDRISGDIIIGIIPTSEAEEDGDPRYLINVEEDIPALDKILKALDIPMSGQEAYNELYESVDSKVLKESRSVADIEAEIARLQQELEQAKAAEKKASYNGNLPTQVWIWDICRIGKKHNRNWISAEFYNGKWDGSVFETEDKAIEAGYTLLGELESEGELPGGKYTEADEFDVEAFAVNISDVDVDTLKSSNLKHLISDDTPIYTVTCCVCNKDFKVSQNQWDLNDIECPHCKAQLSHN